MRIGAALQSIGGTTTTPPPATPPPPTTTPPPASSGDDQWEENDSAATATGASCGINESRLIAKSGDQDWFVFTPPAGQRITIDLDGGTPDLDLYVTDTGGQNILARSEGGTGVERISGNAGGSTLRILVNPYTDTQRGIAHTGPYRLTIRCGATASAQSVGEQDVFVGGIIDDLPVAGEATTPLDDVVPADDGTIGNSVGTSVGTSSEDITISASGGCTSSGHPAQAVWGLGLLAILGRRRRQRA
jgi:MYXO-CTERM domain-containing protein